MVGSACSSISSRASRGWRGVQQTLGSIRLLAELRRELFDPAPTDEEVVAQAAVTPAAQHPNEEPASVGIYTASGTQPRQFGLTPQGRCCTYVGD
jgi:hypothetical protein